MMGDPKVTPLFSRTCSQSSESLLVTGPALHMLRFRMALREKLLSTGTPEQVQRAERAVCELLADEVLQL